MANEVYPEAVTEALALVGKRIEYRLAQGVGSRKVRVIRRADWLDAAWLVANRRTITHDHWPPFVEQVKAAAHG